MNLSKAMNRLIFLLIFTLIGLKSIKAQAILDANTPGKTYELIDSILAPISNPAEEAPDQTGGTHVAFGRHIAEVWDTTLKKYVFEFYIHALIDNDVATQDTDRQRVEIKTYAPSPDSLKGFVGNLMTFKWMFRLPKGFQPSPNFTHIHQIKGVGGDESDPIFTLSPVIVSGTPKLCVRYVADSVQGNSNNPFTLLASANLSKFEGLWLQVTEVIKFDTSTAGSYAIKITKVGDTASLLKYNSTAIKTVRASNTFARPKWGIYRSILSPSYLRDDSLRLAHITIYKGKTALPVNIVSLKSSVASNNTVNIDWTVEDEEDVKQYNVEYCSDNSINDFKEVYATKSIGNSNYHYSFKNSFTGNQYYRLKIINQDGSYFYSKIVSLLNDGIKCSIYPNPASSFITVYTGKAVNDLYCSVIDETGRVLQKCLITGNTTSFSTDKLISGVYFIQLSQNNQMINSYQVIIKK